jgi:LysM repeat protein
MYRTEPVSTRNRDLICWTDVLYAFIGSLVLVLLVVAGAAIGAGGSATNNGVFSYAVAPQAQTSNAYAVTDITSAIAKITVTPHIYHVRPGDTLTKISIRFYKRADAWTVIYWANHRTIHNPDVIEVGWNLTIPPLPKKIPAPPRMIVRAVVLSTTKSAVHSSGTSGATSSATYHGSGAMQQCIIARESGGNPNIWNATGHWGLYQFSYSTWVAHGGIPADFGHAGIAEQNQIFFNTVAADGYSDWAPYDGC